MKTLIRRLAVIVTSASFLVVAGAASAWAGGDPPLPWPLFP
ncbi:MAG TPA: hypothetical protein VM600_06400 [Actinomycetota bacterium]|nr:hypothetical protein [Actinomycetota bacterium]